MGRGRALIAALSIALGGLPMVATASGGGETNPWYLDQFGGPKADLDALYAGRIGVVMARAPRPMLFIDWRLLHGQTVGPAAGAALSIPCCNAPDPRDLSASAAAVGADEWLAARKRVPTAAPLPGYLSTERAGPNYTSIPTCFPDAFDNASATLNARVTAHGAGSPDVAAWLVGQDAVFKACSDPKAALPPALPASAPAWLRADRAYQDAAFALYNGDTDAAAERFAAIAGDTASPWRPTALYLRARSLVRSAVNHPSPEAFARARAAIAVLQSAPAGTFGRERTRDMLHVLAFRDRPTQLLAELEADLGGTTLPPDAAVALRDVSTLFDTGKGRPEALDWMATIATPSYQQGYSPPPEDPRTPAQIRSAALAHARERWAATHGEAWLIAALGLADPGGPGAASLIADAEGVRTNSPAWLTAQYHLVRLTLATTSQAQTRARLDSILARPNLSIGDRNVFTAERAQLAVGAREFARLALRRRLCADQKAEGCVRDAWLADSYQASGVYDGAGTKGSAGFGEDARAVIDRLPLAERIALSRDPAIPAALQLDVALTSYGRAVQLHNEAAIDQLAGDLAAKLPQLQADWRQITVTPPGAKKRFAEYLILAKIPGVRPDLVDYVRPEGRVAEFQRYWADWILMPAGAASPAAPPPLAAYQQDGYGVNPKAPDVETDLACLGECGRGAAPLRLPDFAQAASARAAAERTRFVTFEETYGGKHPETPAGGVAVWDEMLSYLQANPADPRAPEALYWLVRVGRFGGSHEHSGKRAFKLLHARYPGSPWAKRAPYYYD